MSPTRSLSMIMVGLVAWGAFHAVGAYRFNHNIWRPVIVLACSATFLGFWLVMLAARQSRLKRQRQH